MVTAAGSGYSHWRDLAITRWAPDVTCDAWARTITCAMSTAQGLVRGVSTHGVEPDAFEATFSEHRAEFVRRDQDVITTLDVVVSTSATPKFVA